MVNESREDKLLRLLRGLAGGTNSGRVRWEETAKEDMFRTVLPSGLVLIGTGRAETHPPDAPDDVTYPDYTAWLLDRDARIVEELTAEYGDRAYDTMRDLFQQARRSARNAANLLDRMIGEVG